MQSNEIISYMEMCAREGLSLQRGMNFNAAETHSIVLSSHRPGAPYDAYNGLFALVDSWTETSGNRRVFKFKLNSIPDEDPSRSLEQQQIEQRRLIPSHVKVTVWRRDKGACVSCGSTQNLHFDHILPYSKGGTSDSEENIQLLCMRHNIQKGAKLI
jgi:5-methylcytosine-specific restriction endonuclease McrA